MPCLGKLNLGYEKKIVERVNDEVLTGILKDLKVNFDQTHKMNSPNVLAAYGACERFVKSFPDYDVKCFDLAWLWVESLWHLYWGNSTILTIEEVLKQPEIEVKKKSAGTPWTMCGYPDKHSLYDDAMSREWIEKEWDDLLNRRASIAQVTVKKEILPIAKLALNRLRNVMAVDGAHNMWMQRFCFVMHHKIQVANIVARTALGWSPYRRGMHELALYLGKFSKGWEFDGSAWESKMFHDCLMRMADMKFRALRLEERTVQNHIRIRNLYQMISVCPLVMPDGIAFLKGSTGSGGNLTGQVGTAHDNTLFMLFSFAFCFIKIIGDDFQRFQAETRPICLGDDCTFTVSDKINEEAGGNYGLRMAEVAYEELGIVFESPCWEAREFQHLGFLSMHFSYDKESRMWLHVINKDKLYSNLLQGGTTREPIEQVQRIANMRNVAWGDPRLRQEFENIYFRYTKYWDRYYAGLEAWETAKKSFVPDSWLERLYTGYEALEDEEFDWSERVYAESQIN